MFNQAPAPGWFLRPDLWSLYMPQIGARVWPDEQSGAQNPFQANLLEPGAEPQFANLSYNGPPPPANSAAASFSNFMAPPAASVWDTGAPAFMPDPFNFSMPGPDLSGSLPLASVYLNGANSASSADDRPSATPSVWDSGAPAILSDPFSGMPAQKRQFVRVWRRDR